MRLRMFWLLTSIAFGCTKSNPAKHCVDGTCIDPNYPFCDVSGAIGGEPGACIATSCTADQFIECREDVEVRCNADGSNYNLTPCDRGCDAAADGCRLCSPGETACTNGQVATCDATGSITSKETCPLGCFGTEPRCTEIDPSNGLGMYFDMVPSPPVLDAEDVEIRTDTGDVNDNVANTKLSIPNFLVAAPPGGVPIRVFVVASASITRLSAHGYSYNVAPAFALLSRGDIHVTGLIAVGPFAGQSQATGCSGSPGKVNSGCDYSSSGGGGGAFATNGAKGGDITNNSEPGGGGGIAFGNERLVPLRGGCIGGGAVDGGAYQIDSFGGGGGAMQLVSRTRIVVDGKVDASGADGGCYDYDTPPGYPCFGGGAGGGILLEAPQVQLDVNAQLAAVGGNGGNAAGIPNAMTSSGGQGATAGVAATPGVDIACVVNGHPTIGGGGGGGLGRVRINTKDGTYTKASTAIENASMSAGVLSTR